MLPTLLGALYLHQTGFSLALIDSQRLNIYGLTIGIYFVGLTIGGLLCGLLLTILAKRKTLFSFLRGLFCPLC